MHVEHSPGPWVLRPRDDCPGFRLEDAEGSLIDYLNESRFVDGREDPEQLANLALIAHAAELKDSLAKLRLIFGQRREFSAPERAVMTESLALLNRAKGVGQ